MSNLSEEEIIERFKILINNFEDDKNYYFYEISQKVLDLYNKKKIDFLKLQAFYEKDWIRKDKIREKIKELKDLTIDPQCAENVFYRIKTLEELLEV